MDLLHGLFIITLAHLLAAASPGPDFVLVSQQTLSNGKKAGLLCSLGISLGLSVHVLYSIFGLSAIISESVSALWMIKILGGGYLIYLGIKGLRAKARNASLNVEIQAKKYSAGKGIGLGFLCNLLNPKAPIYFVSLFTVILSPDMPLYQLAIYGVWMMIIQFTWFSLVAMLFSRPLVNRQYCRYGHWLDRLFGGTLVALGVKVLATRTH